jgi:uncharacterized membrane protein YkgB
MDALVVETFDDTTVRLPSTRLQPVAAAADVADTVADISGPGGIPQLSVLGEALLKDTVLLGAALLTAAESLRAAHSSNRS